MRCMARSVSPLAWLLCGMSMPALAHSPTSGTLEERISILLGMLVLGAVWLFYLLGARRRPAAGWRAAAFHLGTALALFAVVGPLDDWAETSTSAHMTQHMLFMGVVAPLWVISRPLARLVAGGGRWLVSCWRPLLRMTRHPVRMAYLHGLTSWFWHIPRFYQLALEDPWWHVLEHAMFLITAGLFWWAVLYNRTRHTHWALFALLLTLMHTGFLGALLTFAQAPLYGEARDLEDQQLAGLIMWVPGAVPYLLAAAWVVYRWFRQMHRPETSGG